MDVHCILTEILTLPEYGLTLANVVKHCTNVLWTLWRSHFPTLVSNFRQLSGNDVWTLCQHRYPMLGTDVETIFKQHYVNAVAVSLPNNGDQDSDNVQTMLCEIVAILLQQCWDNVQATLCNIVPMLVPKSALVFLGPEWQFKFEIHIQKHFWVIPPTTAVQMTSRWWIIKRFPQ